MPVKKLLSRIMLISLALLTALVSCAKEEPIPEPEKPSVPDEAIVEYQDKYRNFYEIFVRSFRDSDGDGYGDFNGIIQKLDYLKPASGGAADNSLGVNGIWLMPICPSPSYHKYDVSDYFAVDPIYGTMEDFENMVRKCHERNISVIIDMVLNHTSTQHEWFQAFCDILRCRSNGTESKYDEKYAEYYTCYSLAELEKLGATLVQQQNSAYYYYRLKESKLRPIEGTDYFYECNFSDDMPELNYDSELVWQEIEKICDFWIGKGVDGFRFDAVLYFYLNDTERNTKVLRRIADYCDSKKPGFYTIGEAWSGSLTIRSYYDSGFDSFFNFPVAENTGLVTMTVKNRKGFTFAKKVQSWNNRLKLVSASDAIDAPFISNHDMYRSSSSFQTLGQRKMAASLYLMMPGNPFIYYGEEIGLNGTAKDSSQKDPTARLPIKWSNTDDGSRMLAFDGVDLSVNQKDIDGVEEQLKDDNSLLTHYRLLLKLRNQNPQIARGTVTARDFGNDYVCSYTCVYDGTAVMVVHNLDIKETSIDLSALGFSDFTELRGYVIAKNAEGETEKSKDSVPEFGASSAEEETQEEEKEEKVTLTGGKLTLPGRATVVLRSSQHYDDVVISTDSIADSSEDEQVQGADDAANQD